ncbi:MAG TPA: hypothetical protein PKL27_09380 [Nitrosomonas sp.]|nr:hypothetical protein [Nitrosomonas sp.]HNK88464.1 hypothetical protein [Nitrosomonas sp.]
MAVVKLGSSEDVNKTQIGSGENSYYDGPPPKPGYYTGVIKSMKLGKIASGKNQGADRIELLIEINKGEYKGAGIFHNLNLTDQGKAYVNQFLHAVSNGTDADMVKIRRVFWEKGATVDTDNPDNRGLCAFIGWGPWKIENNLVVGFNTKMGTNRKTGEPRAEIVRFVNKKPADDIAADEDDDDVESISDTNDDDIVDEDSADDPWG